MSHMHFVQSELTSMSIWNEGVAVGFVKTAFAALMIVSGAEGSRRSARTGSAVMLYVVERWLANSAAILSEDDVA